MIERGEGAMLGSMSINMGVTMIVLLGVIGVMIFAQLPNVNIAKTVVVGAIIGLVLPLVFFPFAKLLWAAIDVLIHGYDINYVDPDEARRLQRGE